DLVGSQPLSGRRHDDLRIDSRNITDQQTLRASSWNNRRSARFSAFESTHPIIQTQPAHLHVIPMTRGTAGLKDRLHVPREVNQSSRGGGKLFNFLSVGLPTSS